MPGDAPGEAKRLREAKRLQKYVGLKRNGFKSTFGQKCGEARGFLEAKPPANQEEALLKIAGDCGKYVLMKCPDLAKQLGEGGCEGVMGVALAHITAPMKALSMVWNSNCL
jgi:hypothetical protein